MTIAEVSQLYDLTPDTLLIFILRLKKEKERILQK